MSKNKTKIDSENKEKNQKNAFCKKCKFFFDEIKKKEVIKNQLHLADMENLRKQNTKEKDLILKFCHQDFATAVLPILDTLRMALNFQNPTPETKKFLIGIQMAYDDLFKVFDSFAIKEIETKVGDDYDANFHQTIASDWNSDYKENKILKIKEVGFLLHERVIRPTKVIINQKKKERETSKTKKDV